MRELPAATTMEKEEYRMNQIKTPILKGFALSTFIKVFENVRICIHKMAQGFEQEDFLGCMRSVART